MSALLAIGAVAAATLTGALARRTPGSRSTLVPASLDDLRDLDALLSYESPYHDTYRGFVYHGTTDARWQEKRTERSQRLHLSASAEESRGVRAPRLRLRRG